MSLFRKKLGALMGALLLTGTLGAGKMSDGERERVREIVDGDTLFLESGLKVRLSGIQAPKLPLGRPDYPTWPLAPEAKAMLAELTLGETVQLKYGGLTRDRYDRALAQVFVGDGEDQIWVQEEMVRAGLARVYTFYDTWQDTQVLLDAEREARAAGRGIWALDYYDIRTPAPDMLAQDVDSFQIVEGVILRAADVRGHIYLNFGSDWRSDFTVSIAAGDKKRFRMADIDLMALEGARVRVRGWIELENGPMIRLDDPDRLEILY